ncbi:TAXI family TRAP transporter solute-binding subunit [Oceanibacterium hippocampi]|uniref:Alkanesulfonate transporter substrate-binding subunit n=1 Tax=Oceanibacterium hippocampi TaxID=745714 RepID=A0A1Y5RSP3_9PROT|nr:TAXI family TRAP transporter solute-binding subunit [Oceanibacterium hippocampi]SLN24535.1 hypothetical protein OCH7691_00697 [Oceanibacterium hippocampi]
MDDRRTTASAAARRILAWLLVALGVVVLPGLSAAQDLRFFQIGTGSTGGTYFPIGSLIAGAISNPPGSRACDDGGSCGVPGLIATALTTQGSVANLRAVASGRLESGLAQSDIVHSIFDGGAAKVADDQPLDDIRVIANLYPESVHVVVREQPDLIAIGDLRGRRVSLDRPGSGTRINARNILDIYGLGGDAVQEFAVSPEKAADMLLAGELDAFIFVAGYPTPVVTELADLGAIRLLPIEGDKAAELLARYRFLSPDHIPRNAYPLLPDVPTVAVVTQWVVSKDLDEALVYDVLTALFHPSNRALLDSGHPKGRQIRVDSAVPAEGPPLHPGARRFYQERGLLK